MPLRSRPTQVEWFSWPIAVVFITSILVTLSFWVILPAHFQINEQSDYILFYEPVARNLLAGHGLALGDGTPAIRYPPGYSFLLAGLFGLSTLLKIHEEVVLSGFMLLSMGLTSVLVFRFAQCIWGVRPALICSLIWVTYPFALWLTKQPNSEAPFLVMFYAGIYLFWHGLLHKSRSWVVYFVCGLFVGLAMLIRPIALGVGLVMGAILWLVRREAPARLRLLLTSMILLGNLIAILPWEAWLYLNTNRLMVLSSGGVPSIRDGLTFAVTPKGYRQAIRIPQDVAALMQDIQDVRRHSDKMTSLGSVISVMIEKLRTQPLVVCKLLLLKASRSWYGTDSGRFETPIMLIQVVYLILVLWGTRAAWKQGGIAKYAVMGIWLIVLYFWAMTVSVLSILRYMVPAMGLLFVLTAALFLNLTNWGTHNIRAETRDPPC